jgi:hypothetical protein
MAQQLPRTLQPPPDLPNMPDVSTTLSGYLRNFALWCRHGFADKLSISTAAPGVLMQAKGAMPGDPPGSPPRVYVLQVSVASGSPVLTWTLSPPGTGKP